MSIFVKPFKRIAMFLTVAAFTVSAQAADFDAGQHTLIPAGFTGEKKSLENKIRFPRQREDISILVLCQARIYDDGSFSPYTVCENEEKGEELTKFVRAIERAADSRVKISPATVDGSPVSVWFNYSVRFENTDGEKTIEVFPHHFLEEERYGVDYTAPQRLFSQSDNEDEYKEYSDFCSNLLFPFFLRADIGTDGTSSNIIKYYEHETRDVCFEDFSQVLDQGSYIPAMYNNEYVPAQYFETWYQSTL